MLRTVFSIISMAWALTVFGLASSPIANAYANCAEARAAGAAPLYAGQPGYSRRLDRDGDGVACETGSGGTRAPAGLMPSYPVQPPVPASPAPAGPVPTATGTVTTVVNWSGADCIDITAPNPNAAGILETANFCGGSAQFQISPTSGAQMVGADPNIGSANAASCEILSGRLVDSGTLGDGHDINCLTRFDALR